MIKIGDRTDIKRVIQRGRDRQKYSQVETEIKKVTWQEILQRKLHKNVYHILPGTLILPVLKSISIPMISKQKS